MCHRCNGSRELPAPLPRCGACQALGEACCLEHTSHEIVPCLCSRCSCCLSVVPFAELRPEVYQDEIILYCPGCAPEPEFDDGLCVILAAALDTANISAALARHDVSTRATRPVSEEQMRMAASWS